MTLPRRRTDIGCALALFLLTAALAGWAGGQFRQSGLRPEFYQVEFAPAVLFACGQGFQNVIVPGDSALNAFLLRKQDNVACGEAGRGLIQIPLDGFQNTSLYLLWAVALTWRLAGVSWTVVSSLNALLAGLFAVALYGVMRLGMRPALAAIFCVAVVSSPLHLSNVPQLRDYSKAPFLLALLLLMGVAVHRALSLRHLLWLAGLGGVVAGICFGFRPDLLLMAVPFLSALTIFRAGSLSMRTRWTEGAIASAVLVASFALTAAPVLKGYSNGQAFAHVALLGFGSSFDAELGVGAKHYELSALYDDVYQETVVRSYANRVNHDTRRLALRSPEYSSESSRYLISVIRTLPADVAIRAFSAVARILDAPFSSSYARMTGWVHDPVIKRVYDRRADILEPARSLGWAASGLVLAVVTARSVRRGAFLGLVLVVLAGGAAIQFQPRHFFHLEFIGWWAVGVLLDRAAAAAGAIPQVVRARAWRMREGLTPGVRAVARLAGVMVACMLAATVGLRATRDHQQQNMNRLFERSVAEAGEPLSVVQVPNGPDRVTMTIGLPELEQSERPFQSAVGTAYLLVEMNPERCDSWIFSPRVRYETRAGLPDFTTSLAVPLADPHAGSVKILIPVYSVWIGRASPQQIRFLGIDVATRDASCIASIRKIGDLASFPVLVTAILAPGWRDAMHYQTMTGVETREDGAAWRVRPYPTPSALEAGRSMMGHRTTDIWPGATVSSRAVAARAPPGVAVDGVPETPYTYLLRSRARDISGGACAIAEGELMAGGVTFGLLRNDQWYQQVNIVDRGRFVAAGCAQEDGSYSIVLANDNPGGRVTTARLTRIGWVADGADGRD